MKPYGVKRNYNATDDYMKNNRKHRKLAKLMHRSARRTARLETKNWKED